MLGKWCSDVNVEFEQLLFMANGLHWKHCSNWLTFSPNTSTNETKINEFHEEKQISVRQLEIERLVEMLE